MIETDRLVLRRWREEDLEPFAEMNSDPVVMEFFPSMLERAQSDALARRIDSSFENCGYGLHAVEVKGGARFIGFVGLRPLTDEDALPFAAETEVGWRLARRAWGKGYATEAALASLDFGFSECGLSEIVSFTSVLNEASQRVMQRIGMHRTPAEDFLHPRIARDDRLSRHVLYRISRSEWAAGDQASISLRFEADSNLA